MEKRFFVLMIRRNYGSNVLIFSIKIKINEESEYIQIYIQIKMDSFLNKYIEIFHIYLLLWDKDEQRTETFI